jgi:anthranilate synthase component 1
LLQELTQLENKLSTKDLSVESYSLSSCDLYQIQQSDKENFPFLLETVSLSQSETDSAQFSVLFAYPQAQFCLQNPAEITEFKTQFEADFLKNKKELDIELPFTGGWFCYFSYDYAQVIESSLAIPQSNLPLSIITRIPCAYIYDHLNQIIHLIAEPGFENKLSGMHARIPPPGDFSEKTTFPKSSSTVNKVAEENEAKYLDGIAQIKNYILDGDIFQVNLSRQWHLKLETEQQQQLYPNLRKTNPAPYAANVYYDDFQIISSSPERLVKYDAKTNWVETRPIAGTRKRSADDAEDKALVDELINHPKEIAEHIMLIDLERNDLGRICEVGSIEVNELMTVETYQHVHHIVSNVRGKLKRGQTPLNIIDAVFPGGTITGCPKIRCMEIIAELEQMPRDAYTGSIGYINRDGSMDTNILIRTLMLQNKQLSFRAGAGIVADSVAKKELEEARHKAKGLIQSLSGKPQK